MIKEALFLKYLDRISLAWKQKILKTNQFCLSDLSYLTWRYNRKLIPPYFHSNVYCQKWVHHVLIFDVQMQHKMHSLAMSWSHGVEKITLS